MVGAQGAEGHGRRHRELKIMVDTTGQTRSRSKATRRGTERSGVEPGLIINSCCSGD